ncbi:MAG: hypothetical protein HY378_01750 [Candidatus Brennerbacteria bacterium]|nr:hypothetical protein [Candidatus Brennerbacteria bacterium]
MDEQQNNKFTESELVVGGLGFLLIDGFCFFIDFAPGIGWMITAVTQTAATFAIEQWIENKGGDLGGLSAKRIGKYFLNAVPWFPTTFGIFLVSALIHNNPKVAGAVAKTAKPAGKMLKKAA